MPILMVETTTAAGEGVMELGNHDELVWAFIRKVYHVETWQEFLEAIART